jgi:hypothetical protein
MGSSRLGLLNGTASDHCQLVYNPSDREPLRNRRAVRNIYGNGNSFRFIPLGEARSAGRPEVDTGNIVRLVSFVVLMAALAYALWEMIRH